MKRVLLIGYLFPPAHSIGSHRLARMARLLPRFGYEVEVLTTDEASGEGRVDLGLLKLVPPETTIHRVPARYYFGRNRLASPPTSGKLRIAWWKLRGYAELLVNPPDAAALWAKDVVGVGAQLVRRRRYHVILASGPPFSAILAGRRLARRYGLPLVADFRDLWAGGSLSGQPARWSRHDRLILRHEREVVADSARIIFTNPEAAEYYRSLYPTTPREVFRSVSNAFDSAPEEFEPVGSEPSFPSGNLSASEGRLTLLHAGSLAYGRDRCALNLLHAIARLRDRSDLPPLRMLFAGSDRGVEDLAKAAGVADLVETLPWLSHTEALKLQHRADVLVAFQSPDPPVIRLAVPAKLFEYMRTGNPILGVVSGSGPTARIIREHGLGEVGSATEVADIERALVRLVGKIRLGWKRPDPPACFSATATIQDLANILDEVALPD